MMFPVWSNNTIQDISTSNKYIKIRVPSRNYCHDNIDTDGNGNSIGMRMPREHMQVNHMYRAYSMVDIEPTSHFHTNGGSVR